MRAARAAPLVVAGLLVAGGSARADSNDLTLERLIGPPASPGAFNDPGPGARTQYLSLMSELGVVLAPRLLAPADTLGWSGFQLSFDTSYTQVSRSADFWQSGVSHVSSSFLPTLTVMAKKGLWFPLPSLELGAGGSKLMASNLYALQAYAKLALHEGYHDHPIPSLAVRAAVSRLMGSPQVDMTVLALDATVSKSFGVAGVLKLDPYLAAGVLLDFVRGQVIDTTPDVDAEHQGPNGPDLNANTIFPDPDTIVRWRVLGGLRLVYAFAALTAEVSYTLCNDSGRSCGQDDPGRITDRSRAQLQLTGSASLIF